LAGVFFVAALAGGDPGPVAVDVARVTEEVVPDFKDYVGRTEAREQVQIKARVTGFLAKVSFEGKEGQLVKKGEVLYEIDSRTYVAELKKAEAEAARHGAAVDRLRADLRRARAAGVAVSREELDRITASLEEAAAALAAAKVTVARRKLDVDFCMVTAPISGRVGRTLLTAGNLVTADRTKLTTIVSVGPIYAYFDLDESTALRVRKMIRDGKFGSAREAKMPIYLATRLEDGVPKRKGVFDFIDSRVDPDTGSLRARGVFPNADDALTPGQFVRIRLPLGEGRKCLMVPEGALRGDRGKHFVHVVNDKNEVERRDVEVGSAHEGRLPILRGLKRGERVIVGMPEVRPGTKVEPKDIKTTPK
jgi:RND family efflux transporter MFP subunit